MAGGPCLRAVQEQVESVGLPDGEAESVVEPPGREVAAGDPQGQRTWAAVQHRGRDPAPPVLRGDGEVDHAAAADLVRP